MKWRTYILAGCNFVEGRPENPRYENLFPNRLLRDKKTFQRLDKLLPEAGTLKCEYQMDEDQCMRSRLIVGNGYCIASLHRVQDSNGINTRGIVVMENIEHVTEWRIFRELPY